MNAFPMLATTWQTFASDILHLGVAYALALPIGWNRERAERTAGVRTFPIVALAACGFVMIGTAIPGSSAESYSRILQGLIVGIGFIGGGAILRDKGGVTGTATAASIWNIGIVGAAVGLDQYVVAVILALINFVTLKFLTPIKHEINPVAASRPLDGDDQPVGK